MHTKLLDVLVARNVINENSEFTIPTTNHGFSTSVHKINTFNYVSHSGDLMKCSSIVDGQILEVPIASVITIDGMAPSRLASIYALNEHGESVRQGMRRGRKPKLLNA
jgi:hypothetical protein